LVKLLYTFEHLKRRILNKIDLNPLTTMMINHLEMADKDLKLYCKDSSTQKYRQNIMITLCYFSK
jgi:hypothetical protein